MMANRVLKWLILLALLLLIISFISFWYGSPSFSESGVKIEIEGPNQASVGDEAVYTLKYANETKVDLHDLRFKFSYPEESIVIRDDKVVSDLTESWTIDKLSRGQSGEREFRAFLVGDRGNIKNTEVVLSFKAGDLRSTFEKTTSFSTTIISLPVSLTLVAPPNSVSGQTISYILDYRNESGNDISDLRFEFDYPDDFSPRSFTPSPDRGLVTWDIAFLDKGQGGRITIKGVLTGREGESKLVSVVLKRKILDQYVNYEKASSSSTIANPLLSVDVLVNNSEEYFAYTGDTLNYLIKYQNDSKHNLSGLNLTVQLEGGMFDFSTLDTKGGFFDSSNNTIIWNASSVPDFSNLFPNKKGEIEFRVKLKSEFSSTITGSKDLFVKTTTKLSTPNVPPGVGGQEVSAVNTNVIKVSTQPTFDQFMFYDDPNFGSGGPLPLEVGQETVFTIHWQISNPGNDMNDVKIKGILPAGVQWKNIVSVGSNQAEPTYNANNAQVIWDVGILPQGVGVFTSKYEAAFQVSVTPSENQKGSSIPLLKNVEFSGMDSFTEQYISLPGGDLNTNSPADRPNDGTVVE